MRNPGTFFSTTDTLPAKEAERRVAFRTPSKSSAQPPSPAPFPLNLVLFGALISGLGEFAARVAVLHWSPYLDGSFLLNIQAIWMGPLAALPVTFLIVLLAWLIGSRFRTDAVRFGLPLGAVFFMAALQVGMTTSRIHVSALAVLALGVAVQLSRWMAARQAATTTLIRRTTVALLAVSIGGGLGWNAWKRTGTARAYAAVPAPGQAPNVLLLILDTVGAKELSAYGYGRPTSPFLASFAADGIRFERAVATASWTLPSHASFFTGRYPNELHVGWTRPLDDRFPTVAEEFAKSGFATAGFAANSYYGTWRHGLGRGFQHYSDFSTGLGEVLSNSNVNRKLERLWSDKTGHRLQLRHRDAAEMNADLLGWIDRRPAGKPFFAFVNYIDAHSPYLPPEPYRSMYSGSPSRDWLVNKDFAHEPPTPELEAALRDAYDGAITYLDSQLAHLYGELKQRGLDSNTVVLITADHGESLGEHGFLEHGVSLYLSEIHVPMFLHLPGNRYAGCTVQRWVTLRDIPATLASAASLPSPELPGNSLIENCSTPDATPAPSSPLLAETVGRAHLPNWYPASRGDLRSLILGNLHYMKRGASIERLYDLARDPSEMNDLSRDPAYADSLARLRQVLGADKR